jgi:amino acid adenylation domain-containing protein
MTTELEVNGSGERMGAHGNPRAFWRDALSRIEPAACPFERVNARDGKGVGRCEHDCSPVTTSALLRLAQAHGLQLSTLVHGAWAAVVWRSGGGRDVLFAAPASDALGACSGHVPVHLHLDPDAELISWLRRAERVASARARHSFRTCRLLSEFVLEELGGAAIEAYVAVEPALGGSGGTVADGVRCGRDGSSFALVLTAALHGGQLRLAVDFDERRFEATTLTQALEHVERIMGQMVLDAGLRLSRLRVLSASERGQLLDAWNESGHTGVECCVHELFEARAAETPDAVALVCGEREVSYSELNAAANGLALELVSIGVGPECLVGLCAERSVEMIVSLLGILKAGAAYVALEATAPPDRLSMMLEQAQLDIIVVQPELRKRLPASNARIIDLPGAWQDDTDAVVENLPGAVKSVNLAYVSFTSGSTGVPKGVCVPHAGVVRLVRDANYCELSRSQVFLQLAPISFDASTFEVWGALCNGAKLVIAPARNPSLDELGQIIASQGVTTVWLTAGLFHLMVDENPAALKPLRQLLTGGDVVSAAHVRRALSVAPDCRIINGYGPTENTTFTCCYAITRPQQVDAGVPIGRPIRGTRIYILDSELEPVPVGAIGELYAAGHGLARGYLNQPELTREKFVADPFAADRGARMYRTGDFARYLPDGTVEFVGRRDFQVKVRGYRVELGEVESALMKHRAVREAVVIARGDGARKQLIAYVVLGHESPVDASELSEYLAAKLPSYMVPSLWVVLPALPLNQNGKVDRRALPEPDDGDSDAHAAPQTPSERLLGKLWCEVLGREQIGIHQNFFALGGDSLAATQLAHRISRSLGRHVALSLTFEAPTICAMARRLDADDGKAPAFEQAPLVADVPNRHAPFPLTDIQQAYFFGRTAGFELGNVACHLYLEFESPALDVDRLEAAWQKLIERHDMLRAVVGPDGQQRVLERVPAYRFEQHDLRRDTARDRRATLERLRAAQSHAVFAPDQWPLFEISVVHLREGLRIHLSFDLLIVDGFSFLVLFDEWQRYYLEPDWRPEPLAFSFRDYALAESARQHTSSYERARQYWRSRLDALPPGPDLPLAISPSKIDKPEFERVHSRLSASDWAELKARAQRCALTPSVLLCTAYADVLSAWSCSKKFTLNLTLFNRLPVHPDVERLLGDFTTLTLLEVDGRAHPSFEARAERLQQQLWADLEHREYGGVRVLRDLSAHRGWGNAARMPVVFTSLLRDFSKWSWLGRLEYSITQTPQVWLDHVAMEHDGELMFHWDAVKGIFPDGLLQDMFAAYCSRLRELASGDEAWRERIPLALSRQHEELTRALNATHGPSPAGSLHTGFEARARERPDHIAVVTPEIRMSYGELDALSNGLAHRLRAKGIEAGQCVGVAMAKGWEQVVAALGILKAGGAYVPVSPATPQERLPHILDAVDGRILLIDAASADRVDCPPAMERMVVTREMVRADAPPRLDLPATRLAYILFTSGSTGVPKGVMIDHLGPVNTCADINDRFRVGAEDRVFGLSALEFDLSVYDVFGTLAAGATLVLPGAGHERDPSHWHELIIRERVTVWNSVPALMQMLVQYCETLERSMPDSLRLAMLSGDWIPIDLPDRIRLGGRKLEVVSLGGATEASIWSIIYPIEQVDPGWSSIPYGKPMRNQRWYVLDDELRPCPAWVPGDLYIGGIGLAIGYYRNESRTNAVFIQHPVTGERIYRTGDRGRLLPDGNIELLGRDDLQVKIRGHRIELGEIESALLRHDRVDRAVASVCGVPRGERALAAYVVLADRAPGTGAAAAAQYTIPASATLQDASARLELKLSRPGLRKDLKLPAVDLKCGGASNGAELLPFLRRRSFRRFTGRPIPLAALAGLLGNLRAVQTQQSPLGKYQYASAGGLYAVQVYCWVPEGRVEGLAAGAYYHDPVDHRLCRCSDAASVSAAVHDPENRALFDESAFSLFLVANAAAVRSMYGDLADALCWMEAGIVSHLLESRAPDHDIGLCQIGGFRFDGVRALFSLDERHQYLHCLLGGGIEPSWLVSGVPARVDQPDTAAVETELRTFLRARLPEYMVPQYIRVVDALPMTPNGKVDRAALPDPGHAKVEAEVVTPSDDRERQLLLIFQGVLQRTTISVDANFFELGGSSLQLMQVFREIKQSLCQEISIVELFRAPTIRALGRLLREPASGVRERARQRAEKRLLQARRAEGTS